MRLFVADTETSGFPPDGKVVEVCWFEVDEQLEIVDVKHSLIDPGHPIPAKVSGIHGIYDADVAGKPTIEAFMADNFDPAGEEAVLVCHNVPFDIQFLGQFFPTGFKHICTLALARKHIKGTENHKLQTLISELGLDAGQAHRADGDVAGCLSLLRYLRDNHDLTLEDMLVQGNTNKPLEHMPFGAHRGKPFLEIPLDYLNWALTNMTNLKPDLRARLEETRCELMRSTV